MKLINSFGLVSLVFNRRWTIVDAQEVVNCVKNEIWFVKHN